MGYGDHALHLRAELLPSRQGGTNKDKNVPRYQHRKHDEDKNVPEYERKEHEAWAADKALVLAERLILFRVCPLVVKVKHVLWSAGHRTAFAARGLTHLDPQEISPEPRGRVREEVSCQGASFEGASCEEAPRRERWVDARDRIQALLEPALARALSIVGRHRLNGWRLGHAQQGRMRTRRWLGRRRRRLERRWLRWLVDSTPVASA